MEKRRGAQQGKNIDQEKFNQKDEIAGGETAVSSLGQLNTFLENQDFPCL